VAFDIITDAAAGERVDNLNNRVYACPPEECQTNCSSCRGHEFVTKVTSLRALHECSQQKWKLATGTF
jgi:hypothetical protein